MQKYSDETTKLDIQLSRQISSTQLARAKSPAEIARAPNVLHRKVYTPTNEPRKTVDCKSSGISLANGSVDLKIKRWIHGISNPPHANPTETIARRCIIGFLNRFIGCFSWLDLIENGSFCDHDKTSILDYDAKS